MGQKGWDLILLDMLYLVTRLKIFDETLNQDS